MYASFSDVKWGQWHTCPRCTREETLLEDNPENRNHWSWGRYKTRDALQFSKHENSDEHLQHFKMFRCETCDIQCWTKQEYDKHCDTYKHKKINKIIMECTLCNYRTCTKSIMDKHVLTQKHRNRAAGIEKEPLRCEPCGYSTMFKSQMEQHMLTRKHNGKPEEPEVYTCDICNYSTDFKHHLTQHNKTQKHKRNTASSVSK